MTFVANTIPSPYDPKDYIYSVKNRTISGFASNRPFIGGHRDQGHHGSCTGSIAEACESLAARNGVTTQLSALALYTMGKNRFGYLDQEGAVPRHILEAGRLDGVALESLWPEDDTKGFTLPPEHVYQDASTRKLERYEAIIAPGVTLQQMEKAERVFRIKSALDEGLPVLFVWTVTDSVFGMTGPVYQQIGQYKPIDANNRPAGTHLVQAVEYDDRFDGFVIENSWKGWGDNGLGFLPWDCVASGGGFVEAWAIRSFNGWKVPEKPGIYYTGHNQYRMAGQIVPEPHEVGTTSNIWMGAILDGKTYRRLPIRHDQANPQNLDLSGGADQWVEFNLQTDPFPPTIADYPLADMTPIQVVQWRNISALAGATFYMGYGQSPLDMKVGELVTL
jgi:hypothetical protein